LKLIIVPDEPCPVCGWVWPNRPKICDEEGWWWRCYNPQCPVGYYNPEKRLLELKRSFNPKTPTMTYEEVSPPKGEEKNE
jgi:hypothetical protein